MKKLKLAFLIIVLYTFSISILKADAIKNQIEAIQLSYKVVKLYGEGKLDKAFDLMKPHIIFDLKSFENLKNTTVGKYPFIEENYGKTIGVKFVKAESVGDFLLKVLIANIRERYLIKWEFIFYKTTGGWRISSISWNDKAGELF